jgi:hypothetical protein
MTLTTGANSDIAKLIFKIETTSKHKNKQQKDESDLGQPYKRLKYHPQTTDERYQSYHPIHTEKPNMSTLTTIEINLPNTSITMTNDKQLPILIFSFFSLVPLRRSLVYFLCTRVAPLYTLFINHYLSKKQ